MLNNFYDEYSKNECGRNNERLPVVFVEHIPGAWDAMFSLRSGVGVQIMGDQHDAHLVRYVAL